MAAIVKNLLPASVLMTAIV